MYFLGSQNPDDQSAYVLRGDVYLGLKEYDKAFQDFTQSLELSPQSQDSLVGRAISLMGLQKYSLATRDLKEAVKRRPDDLDAITAIVTANILNGDYSSAKYFLERSSSLEQDPRTLAHLTELATQVTLWPEQIKPGNASANFQEHFY